MSKKPAIHPHSILQRLLTALMISAFIYTFSLIDTSNPSFAQGSQLGCCRIGWRTTELTIPATWTIEYNDGSTCTINSSRWIEPVFASEGCTDKSRCDEMGGEWTPEGQPVDILCFDVNQTNFSYAGSSGKTLSDCVQTEDKIIDGITYRCVRAFCACGSGNGSSFASTSLGGCQFKVETTLLPSWTIFKLGRFVSTESSYHITPMDPFILFGIVDLKKQIIYLNKNTKSPDKSPETKEG